MKLFPMLCPNCKYFHGAKLRTCAAYPEQIPEEIWSGEFYHDKPFPGDRGIRFEPKIPSEFLSISDLAKVLDVNPKTVYRAVWSKNLPAYRIGKTWRIAKKDIERFRK